MKPTKTLQVSCVQLHWAKTLERNLERTLHYIRLAANEGSRVALFPETNLTGYYFPYVLSLAPEAVRKAVGETCRAGSAGMSENGVWCGDSVADPAAGAWGRDLGEKSTIGGIVPQPVSFSAPPTHARPSV